MRFRILTRFVAAGGLAAFALSADSSYGQFPQPPQGGGGWPGGGGGGGKRGGGGGFGGGMMNSDSSFDRMVQATGAAGGDVVDYSRISPEYRQRTDGFLKMMNQPPLPTSGTVTREQYRQQFEQRMQQANTMRANGAMGGAAQRWEMSKGGAPGTTAPGMASAPGMTPPSPGGAPGMGGGSQWGAQMTDESAKAWMRRYDKDGDGNISRQEAEGDPRLSAKFDQFDANRDGRIDVAEYKLLFADSVTNGGRNRGDRGDRGGQPGYDPNMQQGQQQWGGGPPQGWGGNGYDPTGGEGGRRRDQKVEEPTRPVVYRYGTLPKELPGWFTSLDEDKDGQIGLYEWRKDGRAVAEFERYDLNRDGLITAEEYLQYRKMKERVEAEENGGEERPSAAAAFGARPSGGNSSGGERAERGGRPGGDNTRGGPPRGPSKGGDSAEKDGGGNDRRNKGGGRNPFKGG